MDWNKREKDVVSTGFPRKEKFRTREEVDAYFATDKIQCLLCGKWFMSIGGNHLLHKHGITTDEYKEMFGLPWLRGLAGRLVSEKRSKLGKQLWADGKMANVLKHLRSSKSSSQRPHQPFHRDHLSRQVFSSLGRSQPYQHEDFEKILDRMQKEKRFLGDVLKDPDVPSQGLWSKYTKNHPELKKKARKIHHGFSYPLQARARDMSPRFAIDCRRLRRRGWGMNKIGDALGVAQETVTRVFRNDPMGIPPLHGKAGPGNNWRREAFEAILDRMRTQRRILRDVFNDPDLPCAHTWRKFVKRRPEFVDKAREIHFGLSYASQIEARVISPRLRIDCEHLREAGHSVKQIAHALGISDKTVGRILQAFFKKHGVPSTKNKKLFHQEDMEAILERMSSQKRLLIDVCNDPDLPSYLTWLNFKRKRPELEEKHREIVFSLPYHVQLKGRLLSPELLMTCRRMRSQGLTQGEIAHELGIDESSVRRVFRRIRSEEEK